MTPEQIAALDAKLASQIGDDVQHIYDHKALFKESRAALQAQAAELAEMRSKQTYRYIGKDGKMILARDLEDQRDALSAELATLRAERDALKSGILSSAGVEYILDHPMETDVERMGRHSAVRGMMVRLGLYPQLEQAIDDAIAMKGGA